MAITSSHRVTIGTTVRRADQMVAADARPASSHLLLRPPGPRSQLAAHMSGDRQSSTVSGPIRLDETRWEPKEVFHATAATYARG